MILLNCKILRNRGYSKQWVFLGLWLVVLIAFLFTCHLILGETKLESAITNKVIITFPTETARFDSRRMIQIHEWMWKGTDWKELMEGSHVCLSIQGSLDRIYHISELLTNWEGPISLAIYIASQEEWIALNILVKYFGDCVPTFRKNLSIHVALPSDFKLSSSVSYDPASVEPFPCFRSRLFVQYLMAKFPRGKTGEEHMALYPQNHMRNIARKTCGTKWVWSTDIDIIPRQNSFKLLQEFYESTDRQNCRKCAYVIPTYELKETVAFPESKDELLGFREIELAKPFHFGFYKPGHEATDYKRWEESIDDENWVRVLHDAQRNKMSNYEPFYVSSDDIPGFEERFIGYGFTRSSQTREALVEGWTFKVLSSMFSIHWGLQTRTNRLSPKNLLSIRHKQQSKNARIFDNFIKELEFRASLNGNKTAV